MTRAIPRPSEAEYREALDAGLAPAARLGVTTLQDMSYDPGPIAIRLFQEYERAGRLTARFTCQVARRLAERAGRDPDGGRRRVGAGRRAQSFADGGLGASTAYFFEPYEGVRPSIAATSTRR